MIDRFRFLLDRPLGPAAARAVVAFAGAILIGLAALFALGSGESAHPALGGGGASGLGGSIVVGPRSRGPAGAASPDAVPPAARESRRRQDPQDAKGSLAARRAAESLRSHRALQHVPFRLGPLSVRLVGARGGRAVLVVSAPTIAAARRDWRAFLRRYGDAGHSYLPIFRSEGGAANG